MKTPVGLVTVALAAAILLAASCVIIAGRHDQAGVSAERMHSPAPN
jgi:hypothetical protein